MAFLKDYLTYASANEGPVMFHVWGAYVAIASAVSRKVWLPFGNKAIYPNIYVLLVGDAGNGKSIAMYNNRKLMAQVTPEIHTSGSLETPPGLWRAMAGDDNAKPKIPGVGVMVSWPDGILRKIHPLTITANEFINFISMDDKGWINALNDIYDEDRYVYRTKNMGTDNLVGPYICMYGGLTTDIANDMQKQKIISTGLARRTIFQFGIRRFDDPHAILEKSVEMAEAEGRCLEQLNRLRQLTGEMTWDKETQDWWIDWYGKHNREVPKKPPQVRSWYASKTDQVIKIAMLTSLADSTNLKLEIGHLKVAIELLEVMERDLYRIFGGVGRNELASVAAQMYDYLSQQTEPISKKTLKARLFPIFDARNIHKEFDESLQYLIGEGRIHIQQLEAGGYIDHIVATPQVLLAWAERNSVSLKPQPADAIQSALQKGSAPLVDPSSPQAEAAPSGSKVAPPTFVLPPT